MIGVIGMHTQPFCSSPATILRSPAWPAADLTMHMSSNSAKGVSGLFHCFKDQAGQKGLDAVLSPCAFGMLDVPLLLPP